MIHTTPVNPNATPEATALLQYLHDIAGTNILAGQHTQTNPMEEVAYIETVTGKSPKLCGFELLAYSPNIRMEDASEACRIEVEENRNTMDTALGKRNRRHCHADVSLVFSARRTRQELLYRTHGFRCRTSSAPRHAGTGSVFP